MEIKKKIKNREKIKYYKNRRKVILFVLLKTFNFFKKIIKKLKKHKMKNSLMF